MINMLAFLVAMEGLIFSDTFYSFFLFWEAIGVSSFLLIGFWSERQTSILSALKAVTTNRVPDIFLLIAMVVI